MLLWSALRFFASIVKRQQTTQSRRLLLYYRVTMQYARKKRTCLCLLLDFQIKSLTYKRRFFFFPPSSSSCSVVLLILVAFLLFYVYVFLIFFLAWYTLHNTFFPSVICFTIVAWRPPVSRSYLTLVKTQFIYLFTKRSNVKYLYNSITPPLLPKDAGNVRCFKFLT